MYLIQAKPQIVSYAEICFTGGLGRQLHGYEDWKKTVSRGEKTAYRYPRTPTCEECLLKSLLKSENN